MGKMENPGIWEKIQKNVQETERLMGQKKYNLSMIKARQTVEYMVKLQCDKAGIVESSADTMIRELYNAKCISKSTAEHYMQILSIGNKATKDGDNSAYNANLAYQSLTQEIYSFADLDKAPRAKRPATDQSRSRKRRSSNGLSGSDLLKLLVPIILIIVLIVLIRVLTPKKETTVETPSVPPTTTAAEKRTEPETTAATEAVIVTYKTTTTLNVRSGPSTESSRIGKLDPDKTVEYLRDYDDFWAVIRYNEQEAYVAKQYLTPVE